MFTKFEHIGVAVKNLDLSVQLYEKLTGNKCYKKETVESEGVRTAFFQIGETKLELLESVREGSAIEKFIEKKGEGTHHVAFDVADIHAEMERLKMEGFRFIYELPKDGADNKIINFLHPKDTGGILVELCQEKRT